MTTIITAILRLSLTLLVCTLYVLPPVVYAQNPDPVMSAGSTGGAGGAGGGGTVTSVEGGVGIDCINNTTDVECSPDRTVIGFKGSSAGTPTMAGKLTGDVEVDTSASPERFYFCGADDGTDCTAAIRLASFSEITGGLADPGSNGVVKRTALNTTDVAGHADITALYGGGSCSGYLKSDGTCDTPAGGGVDPIWLPAGHRNIASGSNITFWGSTAASGDVQSLGSNPNVVIGMGLADAADNSVAQFIQLPASWTPGTLDVDVYWYVNDASTNSVRMEVSTACIGDGEAFTTPSYNTASATSTANTGNAVINKTTFTSVAITNCSAGERMWIKVARDGDGTGGTDDLAVTARFHGAMLRFN